MKNNALITFALIDNLDEIVVAIRHTPSKKLDIDEYTAFFKFHREGGLSLYDIIILSQKGEDLTWSDFDGFDYKEIGSGLYIRAYGINELFSLWIGGGSTDDRPMYIYLRTNTEAEDKIDIRTDDVVDFISQHSHIFSK